jgi:hypothetical protein
MGWGEAATILYQNLVFRRFFGRVEALLKCFE